MPTWSSRASATRFLQACRGKSGFFSCRNFHISSEWPSVLGDGAGTPLVLINSDRFTPPNPKEAAEVAAAIAVLRGHGMLVNDGYAAR